jgi:hypothetical protein
VKEKAEVKEKEKPQNYTEGAALKLVNLLYDVDEAHLLSLTRIKSSREAFMLSMQVVKEAALNPVYDADGKKVPLSRIWRRTFLTLMRSLDMKAFAWGVGLANNQVEEEAEEPSETGSW